MQILTMSKEMSLDLVKRIGFGHLGCCQEGQAYVVPISYAYHDYYLYCCGTVGRKIEWMRSNPRVCVEVEDIASRQQWETVVLTGAYEELLDEPRFLDARIETYERLARRPAWWKPAFSSTLLEDGERPMRPLFFRIAIREIAGHRGVPTAAM